MSRGAIYLLREREFINSNQHIYKVGKTKQEHLKRFSSYPKGSELLFQTICKDCDQCEKSILQALANKFEKQRDIGSEYFKGNFEDMIDLIFEILTKRTTDVNNCKHKIGYDNDELESDDDTRDTIYIKTFDDYIKYNTTSSDLYKVIITNPRNKTGFIKFHMNQWLILYDQNSSDYNEKTMECLNDFIQYHIENIARTYTFVNGNIVNNVEYNANAIVNDILNNHVNVNTAEYQLPDHMYFVNTDTPHKCAIIDLRDHTVTDYADDIVARYVLTSKYCGERILKLNNVNFSTLNIDIVDKVLHGFIGDKDVIDKYKAFCHNTLVTQRNYTVFHDRYGMLTTIITDILYSIAGTNNYLYYSEYLRERSQYRKSFKVRIPKMVIITHEELKQRNDAITQLNKYGIKNVIVWHAISSSDVYKKWDASVETNSEYIVNTIKQDIPVDSQLSLSDSSFRDENIRHLVKKDSDLLFYSPSLLINNFVKWCCTNTN